jgi:hypothetical protein
MPGVTTIVARPFFNRLFDASKSKDVLLLGVKRERRNMVARRDFTYNEWNTLVTLYRHESASLSPDTEGRFRELGLADGNRMTDAGKRLVEHELLMERRNRLQD